MRKQDKVEFVQIIQTKIFANHNTNLFARQNVSSLFDFAEGALTEGLSKDVVSHSICIATTLALGLPRPRGVSISIILAGTSSMVISCGSPI